MHNGKCIIECVHGLMARVQYAINNGRANEYQIIHGMQLTYHNQYKNERTNNEGVNE